MKIALDRSSFSSKQPISHLFGGMLGSEQVDRDSKTFKRAFSPKIAKEFDQMASQQQPQAFLSVALYKIFKNSLM